MDLVGSRTTTRRAGARCGWQRSLVVASVIALLMAACGGGAGRRSTPPSTLEPDVELAACTVGGRAARCGTLSAPEDRLTRTGRLIDVGVVVLPATGDRPAADPVV